MIVRAKNGNRFTKVSNALLWDKTLSIEAKGLMCYLLSCKDDCNFTIEKIMYNTNTKRRKMDRIMQELIGKGYFEKKIIKGAKNGS